MTNLTREISRLLLAIIAAFTVIFLASTYYGVIRRENLLNREDNPRLVEAQQAILRGSIYDRHGNLLAKSETGSNRRAVREYLNESMYSALGYYSYRYGAGGVESAFDTLLSGVSVPPRFGQLILNQPALGIDIRLSYNGNIQRALVESMGTKRGAAVAIAVPTGEILALVSLPTYNPNTLDTDWEQLTQAEGNPFFNRVIQGTYQPGSMAHLPALLTALTQNQPINTPLGQGNQSVMLADNLTLTCLRTPAQAELTLTEAYLYGCPAPFMQASDALSPSHFRQVLSRLRWEQPIDIYNYTPPAVTPAAQTAISRINRANFGEHMLGQDDLSISPLSVAVMTAALINEGNAPQLYLLRAVRPPHEEWQSALPTLRTNAYMTSQDARRLTELMRASAREGTASSADWGSLDIGAHAAIAYSGEESHVWFTGFVILENRQNVVVTVVLEDTADITEAVAVGQAALQAASDTPTTEQRATNTP